MAKTPEGFKSSDEVLASEVDESQLKPDQATTMPIDDRDGMTVEQINAHLESLQNERSKIEYLHYALRKEKLLKDGTVESMREIISETYEKGHEYDSAAEMWERAGQLDKAAAVYERNGMPAKAAEFWEQAKDPEKAAMVYERANKFKEAGWLWKQMGNVEKAAAAFVNAGQECYAAASQMLEQLGKFGDAADLMQKSALSDRQLSGGSFPQYGSSSESKGQMDKAAELWGLAGQPEKAQALYEQALEMVRKSKINRYPQSGMEVKDLNIAALLIRLDRAEEAADMLNQKAKERFAEKDKEEKYNRTSYLRSAADILMKAEQPAKAAKLYEEISKKMGDSWGVAEINYLAATAWERAGEFEKAAEIFEDKPVTQYTHEKKPLDRAIELMEKAGNQGAVARIQERQIKESKDPVALAGLYERTGRLEEAAKLFESNKLLGDAGRVWEKLGKPGRAAALYEQQLEKLEESGDYEKIGLMWEKAGKPEQAVKAFKTAYDKLQESQKFVELAGFLERRGQLDEAIEIYKSIKKFGEAGQLLVKQDKLKEAAECYFMSEKTSYYGSGIASLCEAARIWAKLGDHENSAKAWEKQEHFQAAAQEWEKAGDFEKAAINWDRAGNGIRSIRARKNIPKE